MNFLVHDLRGSGKHPLPNYPPSLDYEPVFVPPGLGTKKSPVGVNQPGEVNIRVHLEMIVQPLTSILRTNLIFWETSAKKNPQLV
ncbi:MAG: hypothetical protein VKL59_16035 [Nostocaceae cyanobacterium]|nr:hypothetical protein [Nostocaceae cyanobacterium]